MRRFVLLAGLVVATGCGKSDSAGNSSTGTTATVSAATGTGAGGTSSGSSTATSTTAASSSSSGSSTATSTTTAASSSSSGSSGSTGSVGSSGSTTGSPVTLEAFRERVLVVDGGPILEEPYDATHSGLVALVPDDATGTYQEIRGTVTCTAGQCTTPAIPDGDYFLVLDKELVETTARTVDLRFARLGRAAPALVAQATPVTFNLTNLVPAQAADRVELSDLNASFIERKLQVDVQADDGGAAFVPGETALSGRVDWRGRPQVMHTLGDPLFVSQLSYTDGGVGGRSYSRTLARYQDLSGQDILDGVPTTITGALDDVTNGNFSQVQPQWTVDVPGAFTTALPAGFVFDRVGLELGVLPHYGKLGLFSGSYTETNYQQVGDPLQLPLTYNQPLYLPYPPYWTPLVRVVGSWYKPIALSAQPGGTYYANSGFITAYSVIASPTNLSPALGVPRNVQVNGQPSTSALTGVTSTPTFTWDAPSTGTPQYYAGTISQVTYNSTTQRVDVVRTLGFLVPASRHRFVVPPAAALQTGQTYVLDLRAIDTGTNSSTLLPKTALTEHPYTQPPEDNVGFVQTDLLTP